MSIERILLGAVWAGLVMGFGGGCTPTRGLADSEATPGTQTGVQPGIPQAAVPDRGYGRRDAGAEAYESDRGQRAEAGPATVGRVIYFEFDSADVRPESRPVVEAHARYLTANPSVAVVLEGHTDERGTREYNIALGERRAEAVRRLLSAYGVPARQVRILSYGEERPAAAGQAEADSAQNRRVEIIY